MNEALAKKRGFIRFILLSCFFLLVAGVIFYPGRTYAANYPTNAAGAMLSDGVSNGTYTLYNQTGGVVCGQSGQPACPGEGQYENHTSVKIVGATPNVNNQPTTVTIVNACKIVQDSTGWEDHGYNPSPGSGGVFDVHDMEAVAERINTSAGQYGASTTQVGTVQTCSGGSSNMVFNLTPSDFISDPHFGSGVSSVIIDIAKCSPGGTVAGCSGGQSGEKVFSVLTSSNVVVAAADVAPIPGADNNNGSTYNQGIPNEGGTEPDILNMQDPSADYSFSGAQELPTPKSDYTFKFQPDCTYNSSKDVYLKWRSGTGTLTTQPDQNVYWTLTGPGISLNSQSYGEPASQAFESFDASKPGLFQQNTFSKGSTYTWTWYNVDRAHGLSVWLPFSEATTNLFNSQSCPQATPGGNVVAGQTTCSEATLNAFDTALGSSTPITFALYHQMASQPSNVGFDFGGTVPSTAANSHFGTGFAAGSGTNYTNGQSMTQAYIAAKLASDFNAWSPGPGQPGAVKFYLLIQDPIDDNWYWVMQNGAQYTASGPSPGSTLPQPANGNLAKSVSATCSSTPQVPNCNFLHVATDASYGGVSNKTVTNVDVSDSSGNVFIYSQNSNGTNHIPSGGPTSTGGHLANFGSGQVPSYTWTFTPRGQNVTIHIVRKYNNGTSNVVYSDTTQLVPCYSATCQVTFISATGPPGNIIVANQPAAISVRITNTGQLPLANGGGNAGLGLYSGDDSGFNAYDSQAPPGYTSGGSYGPDAFNYAAASWIPAGQFEDLPAFNIPIPNAIASINVPTFAHVSFSNFALGIPCSLPTISVYQQFELTAYAYNPGGTVENPPNIPYETAVGSNLPSYPVQASTYSQFAKNSDPPIASNNETNDYTQGPYNSSGTQDTLNGSIPTPALVAGDQYCSNIVINSGVWNKGYRGPLGPTDITDRSSDGNVQARKCMIITNEPYFHAYGSGISTGGDYGGGTDGGLLAGWDNNTLGSATGSSTQLSALALIKITGVASATGSMVATSPDGIPGDALSFANNIGGNTTDIDSPVLGGNFGGGHTIKAPTTTVPAVTIPATYTVNASMPSGDYNYTSSTSNVTLNGGTIATGSNVRIFVKGNVDITGDIQYAPGPWNTTTTTPPSFTLVATGNIYIDPHVTELDGLYVAQSSALPTTYPAPDGKVYTCGAGTTPYIDGSLPPSAFTAMAHNELFDNCNSQLTVFGSFVANQINLMRTFGSLRNGAGAAGTGPGPYPANCSNVGMPPSNYGGFITPSNASCGSELFRFSPEMYLSSTPPSSNGLPPYDTETSLPPVL
jgi:hypothetical protein